MKVNVGESFNAKIVIGMSFGDEGKGLTTSFLCNKVMTDGGNPIVVRANGGHQAAHNVIHDGKSHIFSNFGSGTLQGVASYWSEYCTFSPNGVFNEYKALFNLGKKPILYVNPLCAVTTPYDSAFNQVSERQRLNRHGSCGVGYGSTIQRQEDYYKLFVQDLYHEKIMMAKLDNIRKYYKLKGLSIDEINIEPFLEKVKTITDIIKLNDGSTILNSHELIFEGAQGILLDKDFGFFPNVTRSNTTSRNPLELINRGLGYDTDIYYVTRAYQTRHGNGFMTNENISSELKLVNTENETNVSNEYQGEFRKSVLDIDMLNYSLTCDNNFSRRNKKHLVITCVDQTDEVIPVTKNGVLMQMNVAEISSHLCVEFRSVYISRGGSFKDVSLI